MLSFGTGQLLPSICMLSQDPFQCPHLLQYTGKVNKVNSVAPRFCILLILLSRFSHFSTPKHKLASLPS